MGMVKPQTSQQYHILENSTINSGNMAHMISKRSGLKTSNEEMTMFSRKVDSQRGDKKGSQSRNEG